MQATNYKYNIVKVSDFRLSVLKNTRQFTIQTKFIKITKWGIPPINKCKDRNYIKLYLDPSQRSCKTLYTILKSIDLYYSKDINYKPIICTKKDDIGYEDGFLEGVNKEHSCYNYCIIRLDLNYNNSVNLEILIKNKDDIQIINVHNIADLEQYIVENVKIQMYINVNILNNITLSLNQLTVIPKKNKIIKQDTYDEQNIMHVCI